MPTPIVERYGALSATGVAKEAAFGTVTAATVFVPMTGNNLELDPGLFSPHVMFGQRDLNVYPLYGQNKIAGSLNFPLFPSQGITLLAGSIGADASAGNGVTGTGSTSATTLNGATSANAGTIVVTSATGYTNGSIIQVDVNASGPTTTAEVRKVTNVATNTLTLDVPLTYAHANGAAVKIVAAPYTHTITQALSLPSFTVEKNLGGAESLQFSGSRVNKWDLQVQNSNAEAACSVDLIAKHAAVLATPTAITTVNEMPYVFAETSVTLFSTLVTQTVNAQVTIENGLKDTYTLNQSHDLQFLTPATLHVTGKTDLSFFNLDDATWGYWTQMVNGTEGALLVSLAHPASGGTVSINLNRARIRTSGDAIKMDDIIISTLNFEAFLNMTTLQTVAATVINGVYLPY